MGNGNPEALVFPTLLLQKGLRPFGQLAPLVSAQRVQAEVAWTALDVVLASAVGWGRGAGRASLGGLLNKQLLLTSASAAASPGSSAMPRAIMERRVCF